jgi:hypothetical protein
MTEMRKRRLNWWAGAIAAAMFFPIAWLSFDNITAAIIMAGSAGVAGLLLFRSQGD